MLKFFKQFFAPYEVKAVRAAASELVEKCAPLTARNRLMAEVAGRIDRATGIENMVRAEHIPASRVAATILMDICTALLSSGELHHFGALNMAGRGVLETHRALCEHLEAAGMLSAEDAEEMHAYAIDRADVGRRHYAKSPTWRT